MRKFVLIVCAAAALAGVGDAAQAVTIGFTRITNNGSPDIAAQLTAELVDLGSGQIKFTFMNDLPAPATPVASHITKILFENGGGSLGALTGLLDADDGAGGDPNVDFSAPANNGVLPGGNGPPVNFVAAPRLSADADSPAGTGGNGVDVGETLGIFFSLAPFAAFSQVTGDLADGGLRIGMHVQGITGSNGFSDGFISTIVTPGDDDDDDDETTTDDEELIPAPMPEPVTAVMGLLGGAALALAASRRRRPGR